MKPSSKLPHLEGAPPRRLCDRTASEAPYQDERGKEAGEKSWKVPAYTKLVVCALLKLEQLQQDCVEIISAHHRSVLANFHNTSN